MNDYKTQLKLSEFERGIIDLKRSVDSIAHRVTSTDEIWDNSDLIRNWHVSERTLATWRSKGLITFTKVGKKIFYDKSDRDAFIRANKRNNKLAADNESILQY
jgi:hypothetical protein